MGTLKGGPFESWSCKKKKIFIMDRNDGKCYIAHNKKEVKNLYERFGTRFVEQLKPHGDWVWIILERIPGHFKGGNINERKRLSADFNDHQIY